MDFLKKKMKDLMDDDDDKKEDKKDKKSGMLQDQYINVSSHARIRLLR